MHKRFLFLKIVFMAIIGLIATSGALAQISSVIVDVDGMSCPFCAYGVEKRLKKVDGVKSVTVSLKGGTAILSPKREQAIDISQIPVAIKDAGFTPGKINIIALGTIKIDKENQMILQLNESEQSIPLIDIINDTRKQLLSYAKSEKLVEIAGVIHEKSEGKWTLSPELIKEASK